MTAHAWRAMEPGGFSVVANISDAVHGRLTEPAAVYEERLSLYPGGCFVLEHDGSVAAYLVSHPWSRGSSPVLGELVEAIPTASETYYLHDIALLPSVRGMGAGRSGLALVARCARDGGFGDITLAAVNGADRFWSVQGFEYDDGEAVTYGEGTHRMRKTLIG